MKKEKDVVMASAVSPEKMDFIMHLASLDTLDIRGVSFSIFSLFQALKHHNICGKKGSL